jgi:hypothetical protein
MPVGVGGRGCIWGTEEREYRDCIDDGVLFALLLCPLTAAAMLHGAMQRLASEPDSATLPGWVIERPLVIPTTPIRRISNRAPGYVTDALRALSALAISRRNLVQLFTLLSFVLLVQLMWSLRHELRMARAALGASPGAHEAPLAGSASEHEGERDRERERERERDREHKSAPPAAPGTYWLKRGEGKRNLSVIGFAFFVTTCCVVVKIATAHIDYGVWSDMSHSDIIIATLFYQFCLYVCIRLARRGFTLGELGIVSHAATALFMETVNMTRMKVGTRSRAALTTDPPHHNSIYQNIPPAYPPPYLPARAHPRLATDWHPPLAAPLPLAAPGAAASPPPAFPAREARTPAPTRTRVLRRRPRHRRRRRRHMDTLVPRMA